MKARAQTYTSILQAEAKLQTQDLRARAELKRAIFKVTQAIFKKDLR